MLNSHVTNCEFPLKLVAAHQNPHPRLLKQILRQITAAGLVEQIPHQAMLILQDQFVDHQRIPGAEPLRDAGVFLLLCLLYLCRPGIQDGVGAGMQWVCGEDAGCECHSVCSTRMDAAELRKAPRSMSGIVTER